MPIARDAVNGPRVGCLKCLVYAWTDERHAALQQLEKIVALSGHRLMYGNLL